jgi:hypothetical protein
MEVAPLIKDGSFSEESEWRAVSGPIGLNHTRMKLRSQNNLVRPYYELPLDLKKTSFEIRVGPCRYPELARESCWILANKYGASSFAVAESAIPFRVV